MKKKVAVSAVRQFLQGLNSKSTSKIEGVTASSFNFLGAGGATIADVSKYMREKLYQADVKEITWQLGTVLNATTDKSDDGTTVQKITIPARLEIVREGGKGSNKYTIKDTNREWKNNCHQLDITKIILSCRNRLRNKK